MLKLFITYFSGGLATGLLEVVSTALLTRQLIPEDYAKGILFFNLLEFVFYFCNLGMDQSLVRFFYEERYSAYKSVLLQRCLLLAFLSFLLVLILFPCWGLFVRYWLKLPDFALFFVLLPTVPLFILVRYLQVFARLHEHATCYNLSKFIFQLVFLGSFILLVTFVHGYWSMVLARLLAFITCCASLMFLYRSYLFPPRLELEGSDYKSELKGLVNYGVPSLVSLILTWLLMNVSKFFILKTGDYHALGIYSAALDLVGPMLFFQTIFTTVWAPRMNFMLIHSPFKAKLTLSKVFEKVSFIFMILFFLCIALKKVVILVLGTAYHQAIDIFPWMLFSPYLRVLAEIVFAGVVKSKKSYWNILFSFCAFMVNVLCCYFFIPRWGAQGAAVATALSSGAFFISRWIIAFRYYPFKINKWKLCFYVSGMILTIAFSNSQRLYFSIVIAMVFVAVFLEHCWIYEAISRILKKHNVNLWGVMRFFVRNKKSENALSV